MSVVCREASHAGSWYDDDEATLDERLSGWLDDATTTAVGSSSSDNSTTTQLLKAIISPHAGFRYSAATAAFAYKAIDASKYDRVFILGPSHHYHLKKCGLTSTSIYKTPVGNLKVDVSGKRVHCVLCERLFIEACTCWTVRLVIQSLFSSNQGSLQLCWVRFHQWFFVLFLSSLRSIRNALCRSRRKRALDRDAVAVHCSLHERQFEFHRCSNHGTVYSTVRNVL
jgi:hypothetical protein